MKRIILFALSFVGIGLVIVAAAYCKDASKPSATPGSISITDFGAIANRGSDSTAAIKAAISAAKLRRLSVFVPAGTFNHRAFSLDGVGMSGAGTTSILLAPVADDSNIYLRGSGSFLRNLSVRVNSSHRDAVNVGVYVDHATNFDISSTTVEGGNAGGIFDFGGSDGRITHNRVQDTLADAIHNTNGAHDIVIADNIVRRAGDDMIAVVSYQGQSISHNILIENNDLADQEAGRGISVVGGQDVTIQGNKVANTNCCAGIYLASEGAWKTNSVRNVLVRNNTLSDNSGATGHGAIMIFADRGSVSNISLQDNTIIRARHAAVTLSGSVEDVAVLENHFINPAGGGVTGQGTNVHCAGNILNGALTSPKGCESQGQFKVTGARLKAN